MNQQPETASLNNINKSNQKQLMTNFLYGDPYHMNLNLDKEILPVKYLLRYINQVDSCVHPDYTS